MVTKIGIASDFYEVQLSSFKEKCNPDQKIQLNTLCNFLETPHLQISKPRDIYLIYQRIFKLKEMLPQERRNEFFQLLTWFENKRVFRLGVASIVLDFSPIFSEKVSDCSLEVLERGDPIKTESAAKAINQLSEESFGWHFPDRFIQFILESPHALCVVAKNEDNQIIGAVFGTYITLKKCNEQIEASKIFHFWFLARKASYPAIQLCKRLKPFLKHIDEKFVPDFLSLNVDIDHLSDIEIYTENGFKEVSRTDSNTYTKSTALFMVKNTGLDQEPPSREQITKALKKQAFEILGVSGMLTIIAFEINQMINRLWYKSL